MELLPHARVDLISRRLRDRAPEPAGAQARARGRVIVPLDGGRFAAAARWVRVALWRRWPEGTRQTAPRDARPGDAAFRAEGLRGLVAWIRAPQGHVEPFARCASDPQTRLQA